MTGEGGRLRQSWAAPGTYDLCTVDPNFSQLGGRAWTLLP
jgi:hypothetical protein